MTEIITQGGTETALTLTIEQREQAQALLAELVLLSAAVVAVRGAALTKAERARRLRPILARREALEAALFPER